MRVLAILVLCVLLVGMCGCEDASWVIVINNSGGNMFFNVEDPPDSSTIGWASTELPAVGPGCPGHSGGEPRPGPEELRTE